MKRLAEDFRNPHKINNQTGGKRKMTLLELQGVLGDRIDISLRDDLTAEERQEENEQSALIMGLAKQMINNGDLILRTEKLMAQTKSLKHCYAMDLINGGNND